MTAGFAVLGAGVIGSSIAYHLARAGARVIIYDPNPVAPPSASWASAGGIRRQDRDPREWPLAIEAAARWPGLAGELGADLEFRPGGHLHVTEREEALPELAARVERERAGGLGVELVDGRRARAIAPLLGPSVVGGVFSAGDGQADPRLVSEAFRAAAVRQGAEFRRHPIEGGARPAPTTVVAAGSWTARLLDLPVKPVALQMLLSDPCPAVLAPTVGAEERRLSFKQLPSGEFFIGGGWPAAFDEKAHRCRVLRESVEGSWRTASELIPALAERRLARSICGLEGESPDGVPLIGRLSETLYVAAGFSGHGFQLAPAVGRAVADDLLGRPVPELAALSPTRARAERRP